MHHSARNEVFSLCSQVALFGSELLICKEYESDVRHTIDICRDGDMSLRETNGVPRRVV